MGAAARAIFIRRMGVRVRDRSRTARARAIIVTEIHNAAAAAATISYNNGPGVQISIGTSPGYYTPYTLPRRDEYEISVEAVNFVRICERVRACVRSVYDEWLVGQLGGRQTRNRYLYYYRVLYRAVCRYLFDRPHLLHRRSHTLRLRSARVFAYNALNNHRRRCSKNGLTDRILRACVSSE